MFVFCNVHHEVVIIILKPDYKDIWRTQCTSIVTKDRMRKLRDCNEVRMYALITTLFSQAVHKSMRRAEIQKLIKEYVT